MTAPAPDWDELRYRLYLRRAELRHHQGHDWDVADVVEVVQEWAEEDR